MLKWALTSVVCVLVAVQAVAADPVRAGRTLRVGDIVQAGDLSGPADAMIGLEVRRAIYAGHPVSPSDSGPPTLVRRNEVVTMTYRSGGIALRAEGRALDAGGAGEPIDVMNLASRRTVRAIVVGTRSVEIRR